MRHDKEAQKKQRAEKRAAALRENLKRRKAQAHERLNDDGTNERPKENDDEHGTEQEQQRR